MAMLYRNPRNNEGCYNEVELYVFSSPEPKAHR